MADGASCLPPLKSNGGVGSPHHGVLPRSLLQWLGKRMVRDVITVRRMIKLLLSEGECVVDDSARVELTGEDEAALRVRVRLRRPLVRADQHVAAQRQTTDAHRPSAAAYHVQTWWKQIKG